MKKLFYFMLAIGCMSMVSCGDDDSSSSSPNFSFSIDWDSEFEQSLRDTFPNAYIPTSASATWSEDLDLTTIDLESDQTPEGGFFTKYTEDGVTTHSILLADAQGQDSIIMGFEIYSEVLEVKRYEFASPDILELILGGLFGAEPEDIPEGTTLPYLVMNGDAGEQVTLFQFFAPSTYGSSYLDITSIDEEANTITGSFVFDWNYTADNPDTGAEETKNVLKMNDGSFTKVPFIAE